MTDTELAEKALKHKKKKKSIQSFLSSGSTLLNLGATGRTRGCFKKGHYYWFVGDSTSGKTWLALSCFAEACINPEFDSYRLIYDNGEDGALMDIERFFGKKVMERLEPPRGTREEPEYSELTEDLYYNIDDAVNEGHPFIYVMDSMDSLDTKDDREKFKEMKTARRKGTKNAGSYGMSKAKINSGFVRRIVNACSKTGSIVIIISQTRDKVGRDAKFDPKTVAGGRALKFYATLEIWTSVRQNLVKKIVKRGKKIVRQQGIISRVHLKKNRITGRDRIVDIRIYHSHGIDDVGSMVAFLIDHGHWTGTKSKVTAPEFEFKGTREDLIQKIESEEIESELRSLVKEVYDALEEAVSVKRKKRYE